MAKKGEFRSNINLSSAGKQTVGKVVYGWTIDAGRAIIVGIELIALIALGYRFVIDRQIVDLHDEIKKQEAYIASRASDEKKYRSVQDRLQSIKITSENSKVKIDVINEILKVISEGTFFSTNLSVNDNLIGIDGITFSEYTLVDALSGLKKIPSVSSISIDEINTGQEGLQFKVSVRVKEIPSESSTDTEKQQ